MPTTPTSKTKKVKRKKVKVPIKIKPKTLKSTKKTPIKKDVYQRPVLDPCYNLRQMAIQMLLLEDHLVNKGKRCHQCLCKHALTLEALVEEALGLATDNSALRKELTELMGEVRNIQRMILKLNGDMTKSEEMFKIADEVRKIRKRYHMKYFHVGL